MAALVHGRAQKGILPPADFLWLKAVDRPLWYGLHNLGRRTFHVEALALMSHYRTEIKSGKRSAFPLIGRAADALFKKLNSSPLPTGETLP
jgi:intracellular multiplication protein IcmP